MANKDPNMMTSSLMSFVRKHWFASIKVTMVYFIFVYCTYVFSPGTWLYVLLSVVLFAAWIFFDFTDTAKLAMRDENLVKYEYIKYDKFKGLKTGLISQIPGLVLCILILLTRSSTGRINDWFRLFYFILYSPAAFVIGMLQDASMAIFFAPLPVIPIVSTLGYYCGYHEIPIYTKLVYRNRAKSKRLR